MSIIEIYYPAKCKDCKHLEVFYIGKLKRHRCSNPKQEDEWKKVGLPAKTKACELFEFKYT